MYIEVCNLSSIIYMLSVTNSLLFFTTYVYTNYCELWSLWLSDKPAPALHADILEFDSQSDLIPTV